MAGQCSQTLLSSCLGFSLMIAVVVDGKEHASSYFLFQNSWRIFKNLTFSNNVSFFCVFLIHGLSMVVSQWALKCKNQKAGGRPLSLLLNLFFKQLLKLSECTLLHTIIIDECDT